MQQYKYTMRGRGPSSESSCGWPKLITWVKIVAVFEVLGCITLLIPLSLLMINILFGGVVGIFTEVILGVKKDLQFTVWCMCWIIIFINLILAIHLYRGANQKSKVPCQIWLTIHGGVMIVAYLWTLISINLFVVLDERATAIAVLTLGSLYRCSGMVVIYKFIKRLNADNVEVFTITPSSPVILSSAEMPRSEIFFHTDPSDGGEMYARPRPRSSPCSTFSTFESPAMPRSVELEAVSTTTTTTSTSGSGTIKYPDLRNEIRANMNNESFS